MLEANEKQEWRRGMGKRSSNEKSEFILKVVARLFNVFVRKNSKEDSLHLHTQGFS